jgi:hypothetical protein
MRNHLTVEKKDADAVLMMDAAVRYVAVVQADVNAIFQRYKKDVAHESEQTTPPLFTLINPTTGAFCWSCSNRNCLGKVSLQQTQM